MTGTSPEELTDRAKEAVRLYWEILYTDPPGLDGQDFEIESRDPRATAEAIQLEQRSRENAFLEVWLSS